jgi:hypothetical protein
MLGEPGKVGPDLTNIGGLAAERVPGLSAEEYIREAIVDPGAYIAPGCPNGPCLDGIMPRFYMESLSPEQLNKVVAYLVEQRIEVFGSSDATPTQLPPPIGQSADETEGRAIEAPADTDEQAPSIGVVAAVTIFVVLLLAGLILMIERRSGDE